MPSFDTIVIGGGTNGLACAAKLQSSGRKVLVLEARPEAGGAACGSEFAPGYRSPGLAHLLYLLDPRVEKGMALAQHGFAYAGSALTSTAVSATGIAVRSLHNRLTWGLRHEGDGGWRIGHEHTSAPIGLGDMKAILRREAPAMTVAT